MKQKNGNDDDQRKKKTKWKYFVCSIGEEKSFSLKSFTPRTHDIYRN